MKYGTAGSGAGADPNSNPLASTSHAPAAVGSEPRPCRPYGRHAGGVGSVLPVPAGVDTPDAADAADAADVADNWETSSDVGPAMGRWDCNQRSRGATEETVEAAAAERADSLAIDDRRDTIEAKDALRSRVGGARASMLGAPAESSWAPSVRSASASLPLRLTTRLALSLTASLASALASPLIPRLSLRPVRRASGRTCS